MAFRWGHHLVDRMTFLSLLLQCVQDRTRVGLKMAPDYISELHSAAQDHGL